MPSPDSRTSSVITFDQLTAIQVSQLQEVFAKRPQSTTTHTLPAPNKEAKTEDYTFTFYIPLNHFLLDHEIQTLEELNLQNAACSIFTHTGQRVGRRREWFATHQMTLTDWLDTAGLWIKEYH